MSEIQPPIRFSLTVKGQPIRFSYFPEMGSVVQTSAYFNRNSFLREYRLIKPALFTGMPSGIVCLVSTSKIARECERFIIQQAYGILSPNIERGPAHRQG